jgi:hypothetical protein
VKTLVTIGPRPAPVMLATLGGTAVEAAPLPPVPAPVWGLMVAAAFILLWAARRPRETSAAARVPWAASAPSRTTT